LPPVPFGLPDRPSERPHTLLSCVLELFDSSGGAPGLVPCKRRTVYFPDDEPARVQRAIAGGILISRGVAVHRLEGCPPDSAEDAQRRRSLSAAGTEMRPGPLLTMGGESKVTAMKPRMNFPPGRSPEAGFRSA